MQPTESQTNGSIPPFSPPPQPMAVEGIAPELRASPEARAFAHEGSQLVLDASGKTPSRIEKNVEVADLETDRKRRPRPYGARSTSRRGRARNDPSEQLHFPLWSDGMEDASGSVLDNPLDVLLVGNPSDVVPVVDTSTQQSQHWSRQRQRASFLIQSPCDCLNGSERILYEALLAAATQIDCTGTQSRGLVQMGYSLLSAATNMCKRSLQRAIRRLISKRFIAVVSAVNSHGGESTVYRVFSSSEVGEALRASGLTRWVQVGVGRKPTGMGP